MYTRSSLAAVVGPEVIAVGVRENLFSENCALKNRWQDFIVDHPSIITTGDLLDAADEYENEPMRFGFAMMMCISYTRVLFDPAIIPDILRCGANSNRSGLLLRYCIPPELLSDEVAALLAPLTAEIIADLDASMWGEFRNV